MTQIRIEVPFVETVKLPNSRNKRPRYRTSHEIFELNEPSSDELLMVVSWREKRFGKGDIQQVDIDVKRLATWKERLAADPCRTVVAHVGGKFYSPVRIRPVDTNESYILSIENMSAAMAVANSYEFRDANGKGSGLFTDHSARFKVDPPGVNAAEYTVVSDNKAEAIQLVARQLSLFIAVDGLVWRQITEPVLIIDNTSDVGKLRVGASDEGMSRRNYTEYSLADIDTALSAFEFHFPHGLGEKFVDEIEVLHSEVFTPKDEAAEVRATFKEMVKSFERHLPSVSRRFGENWYVMRDSLVADDLDAAADALADIGTLILSELGDTQVNMRLKKACELTVTRWQMRPIELDLGGMKL